MDEVSRHLFFYPVGDERVELELCHTRTRRTGKFEGATVRLMIQMGCIVPPKVEFGLARDSGRLLSEYAAVVNATAEEIHTALLVRGDKHNLLFGDRSPAINEMHSGLGTALISAKVGTFFATFNVRVGKWTDVLAVAINDFDGKDGGPSSGHYWSFHSTGSGWQSKLT